MPIDISIVYMIRCFVISIDAVYNQLITYHHIINNGKACHYITSMEISTLHSVYNLFSFRIVRAWNELICNIISTSHVSTFNSSLNDSDWRKFTSLHVLK